MKYDSCTSMRNRLSIVLLFLLMMLKGSGQELPSKMDWWKDARLGCLFIGVSIPARAVVSGSCTRSTFHTMNIENLPGVSTQAYDPAKWVALAKRLE